jgi:hypothetical protein
MTIAPNRVKDSMHLPFHTQSGIRVRTGVLDRDSRGYPNRYKTSAQFRMNVRGFLMRERLPYLKVHMIQLS